MDPARRVVDEALARLRRRPWLVDGAVVAALVLLGILTGLVLVAPTSTVPVPPPPAIVAWAILLVGPLLARRRFPLTVQVVTTLHFPFYWAVGQVNEIASWLVVGVAVYSAGAYGRWPRAAWVTAVCLGALIVAGVLGMALLLDFGAVQIAALTIANSLPFLVAWPLGVMTRRLREYRATLEERNAQLGREREANARQAVLTERVRIARELHDVVAHHVSLMGVQAGAARRLFDRSPHDAIQAITSVEETGRQAITDLQQLVGVLRHDEPDGHAPQPTLGQLQALVASMEQAGLPVAVRVEGQPRALSAGVELSAFRIVQEALTNTLRHAGPAHAEVTIRYGDGTVEVEVVDDGNGPRRPGRGRGLTGMQERVNLYGGRLDAGAGPDGGFRVHALLRGGA